MKIIANQNSGLTQADLFLSSDICFDSLFPEHIRKHSRRHWTPLEVAKAAALFFAVTPGAKILDVGAGIGKFCMAGAYTTKAQFTGIEQRKYLVHHGNRVIDELQLKNVRLLHGNITQIDFSQFTGIYFYNSFYENIDDSGDHIDDTIERSTALYRFYSDYLFQQLRAMPKGTRLATYWSFLHDVPPDYGLYETDFDNYLKLWIKNA